MAQNSPTLSRNRTHNDTGSAQFNTNCLTPRVDIVETSSELLLYADLPGVRPEDVDLRYENGELVLRGTVQTASKEAQAESKFDFYRIFQVHETIDAGKIEAECKNGVLTVRLPKQETAKPKQVAIRNKS